MLKWWQYHSMPLSRISMWWSKTSASQSIKFNNPSFDNHYLFSTFFYIYNLLHFGACFWKSPKHMTITPSHIPLWVCLQKFSLMPSPPHTLSSPYFCFSNINLASSPSHHLFFFLAMTHLLLILSHGSPCHCMAPCPLFSSPSLAPSLFSLHLQTLGGHYPLSSPFSLFPLVHGRALEPMHHPNPLHILTRPQPSQTTLKSLPIPPKTEPKP
jgi:hypothetical protein